MQNKIPSGKGAPRIAWTHSGCCNRAGCCRTPVACTGYNRPPAACRQRIDVGNQIGCPPCPGSSVSLLFGAIALSRGWDQVLCDIINKSTITILGLNKQRSGLLQIPYCLQ